MIQFLKKHKSTLLLFLVIGLLLIPQTGIPIKVFLNRLIAFSPAATEVSSQKKIQDYNWVLKDLEGNNVQFKKAEGKVILINFWATWCPPCLAEMPDLQSLYKLYANRVHFYFISSEDPEKLQKFMKNNNYIFPVFTPLSMPPDELKTLSLPTTYLISGEGKIVIDKVGAAKWNSEAVKSIIDGLLENN